MQETRTIHLHDLPKENNQEVMDSIANVLVKVIAREIRVAIARKSLLRKKRKRLRTARTR